MNQASHMNDLTPMPSGTPARGASKALSLAACALLALSLAACGGGGGGGSPAPTPTSATAPTPTPAPTSPTSPPAPTSPPSGSLGDANVMALYIDGGPPGGGSTPNAIYADVQICSPGSLSNCAVVTHLLVDTGSNGVRVLAGALPAGVLSAMPQATTGANKVGECVAFASGVTWGSVRSADLRMGGNSYGGKSASSIPVHVIADADASVASVPASCASQGSMMQTISALGANGILGVGLFKQDCGGACANTAYSIYYSCTSAGSCAPTTMAANKQVANPIPFFATDNNGNTLRLPSPAGGFSNRVDGLLIFGIGTASNNALTSSSLVLGANSQGLFSTSFNGKILPNSFIDSGSSINFFPAAGTVAYPSCTGTSSNFFCPTSSLNATAINTGSGLTSASAAVYTVNASNAFSAGPSSNAFLGLAGKSGSPFDSFDYGASFFLGRSVATLIEGNAATGVSVSGPAFAYTP